MSRFLDSTSTCLQKIFWTRYSAVVMVWSIVFGLIAMTVGSAIWGDTAVMAGLLIMGAWLVPTACAVLVGTGIDITLAIIGYDFPDD